MPRSRPQEKFPLHCAVYDGNTNSVIDKILEEDPGSIELKLPEAGDTPLLVAATRGQAIDVECLILHGADIYAKNNFGCNCIHQTLLWLDKDAPQKKKNRLYETLEIILLEEKRLRATKDTHASHTPLLEEKNSFGRTPLHIIQNLGSVNRYKDEEQVKVEQVVKKRIEQIIEKVQQTPVAEIKNRVMQIITKFKRVVDAEEEMEIRATLSHKPHGRREILRPAPPSALLSKQSSAHQKPRPNSSDVSKSSGPGFFDRLLKRSSVKRPPAADASKDASEERKPLLSPPSPTINAS